MQWPIKNCSKVDSDQVQEGNDNTDIALLKKFNNNRETRKKPPVKAQNTSVFGIATHVKQPAKIWASKFYKENVQHKVKARCEANGIAPNKVLNVIKHLIKEAFEAEPEEVQQEILAESQVLKEATKVKRTTSTIATPKLYAEAISYISEVSYCFLNTQHEQTGWTWTLLGGGPDLSHGGRLRTVVLASVLVASIQSAQLLNTADVTAASDVPSSLPTSSDKSPASLPFTPVISMHSMPFVFPEDLFSTEPALFPSNSSSSKRSMLPEQGWSKLLAGLSKIPAPPPTAIPINQPKPKSVPKPHAKKAATKKATVPVPDAVMIRGQHVRKALSGKEITPLTVDANGNPTFDANGNLVTSTAGKHKQGKENTTCE
ncbi:hypothetical protein C0995_001839 [Termitomyces sp. Mi166|nr:hypothetical protein C0995_001839 [Termitomyces sp. Mi166\